ncbi:type II toxin-antitoxin system VapC family toxin [Stutzerimonas stutzeri]|uniref:type II toxin-antitoxin system VapC family toxin n=1 Tax=Stutzerimonas stutzeri TaxID=316 RepID=UPI001C8653CF|nr:PIN domain-containing protein [Stutzerimonas stutzeri]
MSKIISITTSKPAHTDKYFVDTNVWFWFTYCASREINTAHKPRRYQVERYPEFIERALDAGAKLFHCPLVFSELANVIERTEYDIFKAGGSNLCVSRKKFRAIEGEREKVIKEIKMAWTTVNSISTCLDIRLNKQIVTPAMTCLESAPLDAYDAFYLQVMSSEGITKLITDDRDFMVAGVESIYTASR